jgi:hypothetical protein
MTAGARTGASSPVQRLSFGDGGRVSIGWRKNVDRGILALAMRLAAFALLLVLAGAPIARWFPCEASCCPMADGASACPMRHGTSAKCELSCCVPGDDAAPVAAALHWILPTASPSLSLAPAKADFARRNGFPASIEVSPAFPPPRG